MEDRGSGKRKNEGDTCGWCWEQGLLPPQPPPLRDQGNRPKQGVWGSESPSPRWESAGLRSEHGGRRGAAILPHELPL